MKNSWNTPARSYAKGIGDAVADRTINRKLPGGGVETWEDVARRVALGNASLAPAGTQQGEFESMHHHLRQASVLMSGRHLQHGDETQATRPIEVYSNCSTSASTFILFYLLLNGSGVGRCYDDDMMLVDWSANMPHVVPFIAPSHPDVLSGEISADHTTLEGRVGNGAMVTTHIVPDSREGWAKAIEQIEFLAWEGKSANSYLVLDFSEVRHRGQPIKGMQGRPASGPGPLMAAIDAIASIKNSGMDPWHATMHADHYAAECVLVGGARRAARMATKSWRDKSVFEFISVKKGGVLWSSNNSVTVDEEFWKLVKADMAELQRHESPATVLLAEHAKEVFEAICSASYHDKTGEPGIINVERLTQKDDGVEVLFDGNYAESERFKLDPRTLAMTSELAKRFAGKRLKMITNPCGEISLALLGGYCVIADVVPYHATSDDDAEDAFRVAVRALIRTNTMNALYGKEVQRTNRIGVGMTGLHEYAWARFGYGWKDIVDEKKSIDFWRMLGRFSNASVDEAIKYAAQLGVTAPHTVTTSKPSGCATPDTTVKTPSGAMTLEAIFAVNGYSLDAIRAMPDATWFDLKVPVQVLDENNDAKSVTKLYVNGVKPVYEIEFEDGHAVKLTGNHKLKTASGWKRVDELTEEDEVIAY